MLSTFVPSKLSEPAHRAQWGTLEIIRLGRRFWLATQLAMSRRTRKDLSAQGFQEKCGTTGNRRHSTGMKLAARVRTCCSNCKSLRNLRCSSRCRQQYARDGRQNAQLHQTRGTQLTNLPAPRHPGRNATCHQTRTMTPMRCLLPVPRRVPLHMTRGQKDNPTLKNNSPVCTRTQISCS